MGVTSDSEMVPLVFAMRDTWTSSDYEIVLRFAQRDDLDEPAKAVFLNGIAPVLSGEEKVELFFDLFEAGTVPLGYFSLQTSALPYHEGTADLFARRTATSVVEHPDMPYAARILNGMGQGVRNGRGVSRATAAAVLRAFDQLADREGFRGWVNLHREAVARAAAGGG